MNEADVLILNTPDFWIFTATMLALLYYTVAALQHKYLHAPARAPGEQSTFALVLMGLARGLSRMARALWWLVRVTAQTATHAWQERKNLQTRLQPVQEMQALPLHGLASLAGREGHVLPFSYVQDVINNLPDQLAHVAIFGTTGGGKTTLASALLGTREGRVLVLSPKVRPGNWRGATVVSIHTTDEYKLINHAFDVINHELSHRLVCMQDASYEPETLTIILDEMPDLVRSCPRASPVLIRLASMGRELRMRVMMISVVRRVSPLGLTGNGDILDSFAQIDVSADRSATLIINERSFIIDTSTVLAASERTRLIPARFEQAVPVRANEKALVSNGSVPAGTGGTPDTDALDDGTLIRDLVRRNVSANRIHEIVGGERGRVLERVKTLKAQLK